MVRAYLLLIFLISGKVMTSLASTESIFQYTSGEESPGPRALAYGDGELGDHGLASSLNQDYGIVDPVPVMPPSARGAPIPHT